MSVFLWYFDPTDDLIGKAMVSLLLLIYSLLHFMGDINSDIKRRTIDFTNVFIMAFSVGIMVMAYGDRAKLPLVGFNVFMILISIIPFWAFWQLAKGDRLLLFPIIPSIIAALVYLVPPITSEGIVLDYFFVPLPVVSIDCVVWAIVTKWLLVNARQWRWCLTWGPVFESLAMLFIVAPLIALTMLAVNALDFGDIWVAVSGVAVGILFGGAVSTPLRQFLLSLGNLSSKCRCQGRHRLLWI